MKRRRGHWVVFAVAVGVVAGAMAWITSDLTALERAQQEARADAAHQEAMRLCLWRMDSWLAPRLAVEASLRPQDSTFLRERYTITPDWKASSELASLESYDKVRQCVTALESPANDLHGETGTTADAASNDAVLYAGVRELARRYDFNNRAQAASNGMPTVSITGGFEQPGGPLVPLWTRTKDGAPRLVFIRRVFENGTGGPSAGALPLPGTLNDRGRMQVYVADWQVLEARLLEQIRDSLPNARLRAIDGPSDPSAASGLILASAPIALDAPRPPAPPVTGLTPTRLTLLVAWGALAFAVAAVGVALRRIVDLSDRRSRFASSVTHELRTPLTTFRLYSEMLADGMVTDAAQRQTYLDTLKSESSRLATLVENVLAYARVEEGRMPVRRERIAVADLLLRTQPVLERRAQDASMTLSVAAGDAAASVVDVDPAVVAQVLFNLVDNACKYAKDAAQRTIEVTAATRDGAVLLRVRDHGPGLAADRARAAFTPFERAGRPAGDTVPGIGLGLALSRALARDLGGDLDLERGGDGASFVLTLPTTTTRA